MVPFLPVLCSVSCCFAPFPPVLMRLDDAQSPLILPKIGEKKCAESAESQEW